MPALNILLPTVIEPDPDTGIASLAVEFPSDGVRAGMFAAEVEQPNDAEDNPVPPNPILVFGVNMSPTGAPFHPSKPAYGRFIEFKFNGTVEVYDKHIVGGVERRTFGWQFSRTGNGSLTGGPTLIGDGSMDFCLRDGELNVYPVAGFNQYGLVLRKPDGRVYIGDNAVVGPRVLGFGPPPEMPDVEAMNVDELQESITDLWTLVLQMRAALVAHGLVGPTPVPPPEE